MIAAYVKYPYYDKETQGKLKDYDVNTLDYNETSDCFYCPMGQRMANVGQYIEKETKKTITLYQAQNCWGCPIRGVYHKSKGNHTLNIKHELIRHRKKAKERLNSEKGQLLRKKRSIDVEPTFGNIKQNKKFKRFNLRGLNKATIEIGLIAIAHNLKKMAA